jgi:small-conductance mechanosensitive channel
MRVINWLLLIVSLSVCSFTFAQDEVVSTQPIEQWDMQALPADWWRQLQLQDMLLLKRNLEQLQNKLLVVHANLSAEQQADTANLSESIATSARAYLDLKSKISSSTIPKPINVGDRYTLAVWLDAIRDLRRANNDKLTLADHAAQTTDQLTAITADADDASAAYYAANSSEVRNLRLLDMIERRLAWFVAHESLRLQRANVDAAQAMLEQIDDHWHRATDRLVVTESDLLTIKTQFDNDRKVLEKATDDLRSAKANAVLVWGDDETSRAKSRLQQVIALQASINEATAKAKSQWNERLLVYLRARSDKAFDWDSELRTQMPRWHDEAEKIEQHRKKWRVQLENSRDQANAALLLLVENPPESLVAKQLSQIKQVYQQSIKLLLDSQSSLNLLHAQLEDSETLSKLQEKLLLAHDGVWGNRWLNTTQMMLAAGEEFWSLMTASLFKIGDTPVTLLVLIRVILFLTAAWWLSFWLRKALAQVASRNTKIAAHTTYTLGRLIHYVIMIVGTVVALSSVGIDFSNLAWIAGALSVGIGFGLQDVVKNFVSGLIVMFEKTLKVGDYIELPSGISGTVKEISLRSTLITTGDNLEVVIPNAEFTSGRVVNWTLSDPYRRVHIPFSVSLNSDKKLVVSAVLEAAEQVPYTINDGKRFPQVVLSSLDGKMAFELLVWIKQGSVQHAFGIKASYLWHIEDELRKYEIELV